MYEARFFTSASALAAFRLSSARRHGYTPTHVDGRPVEITFGEMREMGVRGVLVYCHCGHHVALEADRWPDELRLVPEE